MAAIGDARVRARRARLVARRHRAGVRDAAAGGRDAGDAACASRRGSSSRQARRSPTGSRRISSCRPARPSRGRHCGATSGRSARASCCRRSISASTCSSSQLWSGTEAVALYNAVFRLVEALRLFPAAVLAVALPSLCRAGDLRPLVRVAVPITGWRGGGGGGALGRGRVAGAVRLRRAVRERGAGVPHPAAVVSADVAQLRADASARRMERRAGVRRDLRARARRQPRDERAADSGLVDRRRRVGDARHRTVPDGRMRRRAVDHDDQDRAARWPRTW